MAEANTVEREGAAELNELNQDRIEDHSKKENHETQKPVSSANLGETIIMLMPAIFADVVDALDLTGIGAIIARLVDLPVLGILWLWRFLKKASGHKKDPTLQMLTSMAIEISPIGIIPTWTILVLYIYFQDTKLGKSTVGKIYKNKIKPNLSK